MRCRRRSIRGAVGWTLVLAACGPGPATIEPGGAGQGERAGDACAEERDRVERDAFAASASIDTGPVKWGSGSVAASRLHEVKLGFDALQKDFGQMAERLCRDRPNVSAAYYERRRECLDRAQIGLRGLSILTQPSEAGEAGDVDPKSVAMALEARLAFLRDTLACGGAAPGEAAAPASPAAPQPVAVSAWLTCERRAPAGGYVAVADCERTPLTEGDRVRVSYRVDGGAPAHVYLSSRNDRGQFQMLSPAPGADARVAPGVEARFPPGDAWMELDAVAGVTELVQVAAFAGPVPALEAQRGREVPAGAAAAQDPGVRAATVAVEPVLTRGWRLPKAEGGAARSPTSAVGAVELRVMHR